MAFKFTKFHASRFTPIPYRDAYVVGGRKGSFTLTRSDDGKWLAFDDANRVVASGKTRKAATEAAFEEAAAAVEQSPEYFNRYVAGDR